MRFRKWLAALLVLCMTGMIPSVLSEGLEIEEAPIVEETGEIVFSEDVDNAVAEEDFMLFSDEPVEKGYAGFLTGGEENEGDIPIDETHFPAERFRAYVAGTIDSDGDGMLSESERLAVKEIDFDYGNSLDGIEYFPNLEKLTCDSIYEKLDVSGNPALRELSVDYSSFESIDLSKNTALEKLVLFDHKLTRLDVSHNPALTVLSVARKGSDHGLSSLDVSHNPALKTLNFRYNHITDIDLSNCPALEFLTCDHNALTTLDVSKCPALKKLECGHNQLETLALSNGTALEELGCYNNRLEGLDLSDCRSLRSLYCGHNELTRLDISVSDSLHTASCISNPLTQLKLTRSLKNLYCYDTALAELNLYGCSTLIDLATRTPTSKYYSEARWKNSYLKYATTSYELCVDEDVKLVVVEPTPEPTPSPTPTLQPTPTPTAPPEKVQISSCQITVKNKTYTGKAIKPAPVVKYNGTTLTKGTDYTVTYKNNTKVGTATVTVKGIGDYTGSKKATFKINPKGTTISKVTAGKKKLTVTWKKQTKQVSGYQIQYGTKKDFSNAKKVTASGAKTVKKVIKSLKAKKYYYVRIRTYKTVSGKKYYSSWSKYKKVKTK